MQNHVTPATAQRLKNAGFPQPKFAFGQFWYSQNEQVNIYVRAARPNIETHHFVGETLTTQHYKADQVIYAPTATDILRQLGEDVTLSYGHGYWLCGIFCGEDFTHENPAEAAALAWLSKHEKNHASTTN